jgi:hypothetical protein
MTSNQAIKFLLMACLLQLTHAQTPAQGIYLVPGAGIQMLRAKNTLNEYKTGRMFNNSFYLSILAGIGLEYEMKDSSSLSVYFQNGHTGVSMGVAHKDVCQLNQGYSFKLTHATSSQDYRFLILYKTRPFPLGKKRSKAGIKLSLQSGIGMDFNSGESDSARIRFPGTNSCGEVFELLEMVTKKNKVAFVLPMQANFDLYTRRKRSIGLGFFFYLGITPHIYANVDYVVSFPIPRREVAKFVSYGTTYGVKLHYPIKLFGVKKKT